MQQAASCACTTVHYPQQPQTQHRRAPPTMSKRRLAALARHMAPAAAAYEDVLAAHYAANPHVAAQLQTPPANKGPADSSSSPATAGLVPSGRMDLATAEEVLAAHFRATPHVAAQVQQQVEGAAPGAATAELVPSGRRMDLAEAEAVLAAHFAANPHVEAQLQKAPVLETVVEQGLVSGQGEMVFDYVPELMALPAGLEIKNAHGLAVDLAGQIYLTYDSEDLSADTRALVRWAPNGTSPVLIGSNNTLANGTPHGLRHSVEGGVEFLYHANNSGLSKSTLDGDVVWSVMKPLVWEGLPYKPTDCMVVPGSEDLLVADGYGSSFVHTVDRRTGRYTGMSYGGKGDTASPSLPARFDCNHGMGYDPARGLVVYADRANHRLVYTEQDGSFHSAVPLGLGGLSLPCNVSVNSKENLAIVASLGTPDEMADGEVGIIDQRSGKVVSTLEIAKLLGGAGHTHPHDAIFLPNGDVVVSTWNPGRLSYWRRRK